MGLTREQKELLAVKIPAIVEEHPSIITVLHAHSELNLSNLIYYFLKGKFSKQIQEAFIKSFVEAIREEIGDEGPRFLENLWDAEPENLEITTEYTTKAGRIDLLIVFNGKYINEKCALIIENKLYHEANNDFDDYYHSVSDFENIDPANIWTVLLCLKDDGVTIPKNLSFSKVFQNVLKDIILINIHETENDDLTAKTKQLFDEYVQHIKDLYADYDITLNKTCVDFFLEKRSEINSVLTYVSSQEFDGDIDDKSIKSLKSVCDVVRDYFRARFKNYLSITNRSVGGPGEYFRGKGLSFDIIRYHIDYENYFKSNTDTVDLKVFLNKTETERLAIDFTSTEYQQLFESLGVITPIVFDNQAWSMICQDSFQLDDSLFRSIQRDKLDGGWSDLEFLLAQSKKIHFKTIFEDILLEFLGSHRNSASRELIDESYSVISSEFPTTSSLYKYLIYYTPTDLVEVFFYLDSIYWDEFLDSFYDQLKENKLFIPFNEKHSVRFDEIVNDNDQHFYPVVKKSFRIENLDQTELNQIFEKERTIWVELEKKICKMIQDIHEQL